jgi:hypothetical protein
MARRGEHSEHFKNRLRDAVVRKRAGLPVEDDDAELLEGALDLIEELQSRRDYGDQF